MSMRPDDHRRKWDKDEFEKLAAERLQAELDDEEKSKKKGSFIIYLLTYEIVFITLILSLNL